MVMSIFIDMTELYNIFENWDEENIIDYELYVIENEKFIIVEIL